MATTLSIIHTCSKWNIYLRVQYSPPWVINIQLACISLQGLIPVRWIKYRTQSNMNGMLSPLHKDAGIAHRRLMAFYPGSLEGCAPPSPPTPLLPLTQSRFSSRAHFLKCTYFKSKMSDISETNNPRFPFFILTKSLLEDYGSIPNERLLYITILIDISS